MPSGNDSSDNGTDKLARRPPGWDPNDPYENIDITKLPSWWQTAIKEFEKYGLRPYRPPKFTDDKLVPNIINELEEKYGVDVLIIFDENTFDPSWRVHVDGKPVDEIDRRRNSEGYTEYLISSKDFIELVKERFEGE